MAHVRPETRASCPGSLGSRPAIPIDTCSYSYTLYHTDSHILHITHPYTHTPQQILKDPPCTLTHINYHTAQTHNTHTTHLIYTHYITYTPTIICPTTHMPSSGYTHNTHTGPHRHTYHISQTRIIHHLPSHTERACHTHSTLCRKHKPEGSGQAL